MTRVQLQYGPPCDLHGSPLPCERCAEARQRSLGLAHVVTDVLPESRTPNDPTPRDERYMGTD